jgi:hypothetical protein
MKIVIEIDEEDWKDINDIHFIREDLKFKIGKAIMKGTPLPEHHGRLIDADAYISNHSSFGWLNDIEVDDFNEITPTIIEAEGSDNE